MRFRAKPQAKLLSVSVLNLRTLGWDRVLPELDEVLLVNALQAYEPTATPAEVAPPPPAVAPGEPGRLLTIMQAAARLGVSRSTVWRLFRNGTLRPVRLGPKSLRIAEADLVRLAGCATNSAAAEEGGPGV